MGTDNIHFTTGQFAKLHNINKRTLHYYDDIGLFSPAYKGKNGYRYYTYQQSPTLEMLLTLRELNMSVNEIDVYMQNPNTTAFQKIIEQKTKEIDEKIKRLKEIRLIFKQKEAGLKYCEQQDLDKIDIVECDKEYLLLSGKITGAYDENDYAVLFEHMQAQHDHRLYNQCYGSMISVDKILNDNYDDYECFFTKISNPQGKEELFCKPAGMYVRAFCKGSWNKLPEIYQHIKLFAQEQGIMLKGYSYEEGINEIAISSMDEYVTQIMILCE
ncbi:MAG: MerR family transcriptional regulator [Oscillospiraceae bacterium]